MARIIGEVRPQFVFVENSPNLVRNGLARVLGDLAALGYDARWGFVGAHHAGAPHKRDRIWIVAHSYGFDEGGESGGAVCNATSQRLSNGSTKQMGEPETDDHGKALLTSYLEASRAKTSASQEKAQESTGKEAGCGNTWRELSARYDRATSSWKTHQCLFTEDLPESSVTFPKWGMIRDGVLWEQTTPAPHTVESGSGFWPTPTASTGGPEPEGETGRKLVTMVRIWPAPSASDNRDRGHIGSPAIQRRKEKGKQIILSQTVSKESGALNPDWVEWLMGWPIGWTDLKPLAMGRFRQWLRSRLKN